RNILKTTQKKKKAQKNEKNLKKSIAEREKGSMFAAAKNGSSCWRQTFIDRLGILVSGRQRRPEKQTEKKYQKTIVD
ncbi:hypothetical protein, partial [Mariniflexile sp. HMF6888]|uniref:hypothetical protein n=1 Tax=Mariniflexile sp. HMF6888 TaxID=3373086 RepID=UPI00379C0083